MSTARKPRQPTAPKNEEPREDPFRYGWRFVRDPKEPGGLRQVPLTLEDVLHPLENDFIVNSDAHSRDLFYLRAGCEIQVASTPGAVVLSDTRIEWDNSSAHGPDIAVIFGVRERKRWGTFYVAEEGTRPSLIIEVTSPDTRDNDLNIKPDHYFKAQVPFYVIVDEQPSRRANPSRRLRLIGYRRGKKRFVRMQTDARGWLWLETVSLWLGIDQGRAVLSDAQGKRIPDPVEMAQSFKASEAARLLAEQQAQDSEAARLLAEQRAQDSEAARLHAAKQAQEAQQRIADLEVELRRLRGDG